MSTSPELVITTREAVARFDGERLRIERGRTAWTVPLRAIRSAARAADGSVSVVLSGDGAAHAPGTDRAQAPAPVPAHGLGTEISLPAANVHAADAFVARLRRALAATSPVADGHALVTVETRPRRVHRWLTAAYRREQIAIVVLAAYAAAIVTLGFTTDAPGPLVGGLLSNAAWLLPTGIFLFRHTVRTRIRPALVLRRRGVTVAGVVTGARSGGKDSLQSHPLLSFTTATGQPQQDVRSVVGIFAPLGHPKGPMDVTYDPENPGLATRPGSFSHTFWTVAMTAAAVLLTAVCGAVIGYFLLA